MAEKIETANAVEKAAVDTVLAVSRHADGTPAQTPGFKSVDPKATEAISEAQLREQAASAVDYLHRQAAVADEGPSEPSAEIKALKDAQEKAADAAAKKVEKFD
jgi:hypothetical protein